MFLNTTKNITRNNLLFWNPQEDFFIPRDWRDMFWNVVPCFKRELVWAQRCKWILCAPCWWTVFNVLFYENILFQEWKHDKNDLLKQDFFCSALPLLLLCQETFPWYFISSLGPPSRRPDYGWRLEYLSGRIHCCTTDRTGLRILCLSTNTACQNSKIKATAKSLGGLGAQMAFTGVKLIVEDRQAAAQWPPSALMMTNERADGISRWSYWGVKSQKTREEFMPGAFMRLEGKRGLRTNILDLLCAASLENNLVEKSCHVLGL